MNEELDEVIAGWTRNNQNDTQLLDTLLAFVEERFTQLEARIDTQEELFANLLVAYTEVGSYVESLVTEIMSPRTEEERREFRAELSKRHAQTLKAFQEAARDNMGPTSANEAVDAIRRVVEGKQAPTSDG